MRSGPTGNDLPLHSIRTRPSLNLYQQVGPESTLFPLAYLTNREDVIEFVYNDSSQEDSETKSPASLLEDLEQLLQTQ